MKILEFSEKIWNVVEPKSWWMMSDPSFIIRYITSAEHIHMCERANNVHIHSALSKNSVQNQHSTILLGSIANV